MVTVNCTEPPTIKLMEPLYVRSSLGVDPSIRSRFPKTEPLKVSMDTLFSDLQIVKPCTRWDENRFGGTDISGRSGSEPLKFANQSKRKQMTVASNPGAASVQVHEKLPRRDPKNKMAANAKAARWWTGLDPSCVCPITNTPIRILPYPPFNLKINAGASYTTSFVDGKYLAIALILDPNFSPCGHKITPSELDALDSFVQHSKLGRFRPNRARKLIAEACEATTSEDRAIAIQKLTDFKDAARAMLKKLRIIQSTRTTQAMQDVQSTETHE